MYTIYLTTLYKFESNNGSKKNKRMNISADTLIEIVEFIFRYDNSKEIQISFVDGEALSKKELLYMAIDYISTYFPERLVKYYITTNGEFMDDMLLEFLKKHEVYVDISFDGLEETHNLNGIYINEYSAYNRIFQNVLKIKDRQISYSLRVTISESTIALMHETVVFLHENGIDAISLLPEANLTLTKGEALELEQQVARIADYYLQEFEAGRKFSIEQLDGKWDNILCDSTKCFTMCGAGITSFTILPNGNIYPCGYLAFDEKYKIGNIYHSIDSEKAKNLPIMLYNKESLRCNDCEISNFCRGTKCGYGNYIRTGSINVPANATCKYERIFYVHVLRVFKYITMKNSKALHNVKIPLCYN